MSDNDKPVPVDPEITIRKVLHFVRARFEEAERHPEGSQERVIARCLGEGAYAALQIMARDLAVALQAENPETMQ